MSPTGREVEKCGCLIFESEVAQYAIRFKTVQRRTDASVLSEDRRHAGYQYDNGKEKEPGKLALQVFIQDWTKARQPAKGRDNRDQQGRIVPIYNINM